MTNRLVMFWAVVNAANTYHTVIAETKHPPTVHTSHELMVWRIMVVTDEHTVFLTSNQGMPCTSTTLPKWLSRCNSRLMNHTSKLDMQHHI